MTKFLKITYLLNKRFTAYMLIVIVFSFSVYSKLQAQNNANEYDVKKTLIFKMTNFVEWPKDSKVNKSSENIIISIIGKNPFNGKLNNMANNNKFKIKNKLITVRNISSIDQIEGSDILFISSSERYDISKIIKYTNKKAILTIGDTKGFMEKGVMIGLILRGGHIWFSINKKEADNCGFYISSQLLGNAVKVIK